MNNYPHSIHQPLLPHYNSHPNATHSILNSEQIYHHYFPLRNTPMASYKQETNNRRYWETPDNGTSPWMGINQSIYPNNHTIFR